MTEKRFSYHRDGFGAYYLCDKEKGTYENSIMGEIWADKSDMTDLVNLLNKLSEENEQLRTALKELKEIGDYQADRIQELSDENEQLEKENYELHKRLGDFEPFERDMNERTSKTSLEDIIGIVKTDEPTNSVELKKELYK